MPNEENLIQNKDRSPNQAHEENKQNGKEGGIASGIARKLKKTFATLGQAMVDSTVKQEDLEKIKDEFPELDLEEMTNRALMLQSQIKKAVLGDSKAFEVVRDTIGEKPIDEHNLAHSGTIIADYSVSAATVAAALKAKKEREKINE